MTIGESKTRIGEFFTDGGLGRHETFAPRYGWLKKGIDAVAKDPNIFKEDDAIVKLGVGKNMVRSIRSWCLAFKLITQGEDGFVPSMLGRKLLADDQGWDPYLEDDASLWLLHWQLFVPPFEAVSWPLAFNYCNLLNFNSNELKNIIYDAGQAYPSLARISPRTYQRDATCIISMYYDQEKKDSAITSPFVQLGLIHSSEDKSRVTFNIGFKYTLPPLIFAAACFSYIGHYLSKSRRTISLQQLIFGVNSPGIAYKLPETVAGQYLNEACRYIKGFQLVDSLGSMQLHLLKPPQQLYYEVLNKFYLER